MWAPPRRGGSQSAIPSGRRAIGMRGATPRASALGYFRPPLRGEDRSRCRMRARLVIAFILLVPVISAADEKPERFTYRVLGLFSKDREAALREGFQEIPDIKLVSINFDDAEITVEFAP